MPLALSKESVNQVYSEFQQELRRTRTVYETMVVAESGGFAILLSQLDTALARATIYIRTALSAGIGLLAIMLVFLIGALASRYYRLNVQLDRLERDMGFPQDDTPTEKLGETPKKGHLVWAGLLSLYTAALCLMAMGSILSRNGIPASRIHTVIQCMFFVTVFGCGWFYVSLLKNTSEQTAKVKAGIAAGRAAIFALALLVAILSGRLIRAVGAQSAASAQSAAASQSPSGK